MADTIVVPFNDIEALDAAFAANGSELAAALVEPVAANMGWSRPMPASSSTSPRRCAEHGALFVCDEVITGFRLGPAGAQGRFGLTPDLSIFGKVIGGGLPLAAVGGRADVMDHLAPLGDVYQAGTLSGNPLATAAGLATLGELGAESLPGARSRVTAVRGGLRDAIAGTGIAVAGAARRPRSPGCSSRRRPCATTTDAQAGDHERYARVLPRDARPRRVPRAEQLRGDVREPRPHRRGSGPHRRARAPTRLREVSARRPTQA